MCMCVFTVRGCAMSLLSGLFTELEKVPTPRFVVSESVARTERVPAVHLEQQQPSSERMPGCRGQHRVPRAPHTSPPASGQLPPSVDAPSLGEDHDEPQHFIQTAVTASPEWLAARNAFYHHLMPCRACHAPVGRYCPAGAELRQRYDLTPMV